MLSKKNKVILTVIVILGTIVVLFAVLNKFNVVQKFENFVDDEEQEGYEEDEQGEGEGEGETESFNEPKKTTEPSTPTKKQTEPSKMPKEVPKTTSPNVAQVENVKPIDDLSTKLKNVIEKMDNELKAKQVSDEIKKKAMTDLMSNLDSISKAGADTTSIVTNTISKYIPKKETYTDEPVMTKSMDSVKKHIKAALAELENMSSSKTSAVEKFEVNERFQPSREAPKTLQPTIQQDTSISIEGFENAPLYALY
jgi:hypothetical protein